MTATSRAARTAALVGLVGAAVLLPLSASAAPGAGRVAPGVAAAASAEQGSRLQPWLERTLATAPAEESLRVMVRGTSLAAAEAAVRAAGLGVQQRFTQVGIVVGIGRPAQVRAVVDQPGVVYVEGDTPLTYGLDTAHKATRSDVAAATPAYSTADGRGTTIAVIDSGIDGTHPFFSQGGTSKVVRNLKNACGAVIVTGTNETCFQQVPSNDSDTPSAGGHGTHVSGIAAGVPVTTTSPAGTKLRGSAPGAKLVGLSVGAAIGLLDATSALNWVLDHQRSPCKPISQQSDTPDPACPPIKVTNNSYGPVNTSGSDNTFTASSAPVVVQRALVAKGVVTVWAAGNDGGDGTVALTNPPGMDPTPGILMVASYNDAQNGSRDNQLSSFSSRGKKGTLNSYPDISAPGDLITSSCRVSLSVCTGAPSFDNGNYQTISGTSMATPYTAGVVAQLFSAKPSLTPGQVEEILENTAHAFSAGADYEADPNNTATPTSFDKGHGLLDVLAALASATGAPAPPEPAAEVAAVACGGTGVVKDPKGDAVTPVTGLAGVAPAQDVTDVSFSAQPSTVTVKLTVDNFSPQPAAGSTGTGYFVGWTAPDGTMYAVDHSEIGGPFRLGQYEGGGVFKTGTTMTVPGTTTAGAGGGVTWTVPRDKIGSPVIPIDPVTMPAAKPAVGSPFAEVYALEGFMGSGLRFTAPVDLAPSAGKGASWSVCASGGQGEVLPGPVVPEVPVAALLPLAGLALVGGLSVARRRRAAMAD